MLTPRGWWLALLVLALLTFGVLAPHFHGPEEFTSRKPELVFTAGGPVFLVGATLGLWLAWQWFHFRLRVASLRSGLRAQREISDTRGPVDTLWEGRRFGVRTTIRQTGRFGSPYLTLEERTSAPLEPGGGSPRYEGPLEPQGAIVLSYAVRCAAPGAVRWDGVRIRIADLHGFFYHAWFLHQVAVYRVLPPLVDARGRRTSVKRHNLLPPPGQHRHRRPGSGSELLDLRDYLPGDPPKTIAWKVSARRDRLITKQFESEVPVRCTLFVDVSNSVRVGGLGHNPLTDLVRIASAVAQANAGNRDLTGLCLFDEHAARVVPPARGPRHTVHLLNLLAEAASLPPTSPGVEIAGLLPLAYAVAEQVYPDLLDSEINHVPFWMPWLLPPPPYAQRQPRWLDYLYRWLPLLLPLYWVVGLATVAIMWVAVAVLLSRQGYEQRLLPVTVTLILLSGVVLTLAYIRVPPALFFPNRRRLLSWRKQLAAVFAMRERLGPGGLAWLLEDDDRFGESLERFLNEHHAAYSIPLYDAEGRYLFAAPGKCAVLAKHLLRAVAHGHDNELFVLLVDLLEIPNDVAVLLDAVKVSLARHHRVLVICPWPPDLPPPAQATRDEWIDIEIPDESKATPLSPEQEIVVAMRQGAAQRFHQGFHRLRKVFGRFGVPVLCAQGGQPTPLILERLDLLRMVGSKR